MTPASKAVITAPVFQMKRWRLGTVQSHGLHACRGLRGQGLGGHVSWVRSLLWEDAEVLEMGGGDGGTTV